MQCFLCIQAKKEIEITIWVYTVFIIICILGSHYKNTASIEDVYLGALESSFKIVKHIYIYIYIFMYLCIFMHVCVYIIYIFNPVQNA